MARASTMRRVFSLNHEIFASADPKLALLMQSFNWVQMAVYHRPNEIPNLRHSILLFVVTLVIWLVFNELDKSLLKQAAEDKKTVRELKEELQALGLTTSGNKKTLQNRLKEAPQSQAQQEISVKFSP